MAKSEWFKLLLERGYFPSELPPPFHTAELARYRTSVARRWAEVSEDYPSTIQEHYSIPRTSRARRNLALINPIAQVHLSKLVSDNWVSIRKHIRTDTYAVEVPEIKFGPTRSVSPPDFVLFNSTKTEISSQFDYALVSDISRFYGTLYTHAIPWALHGKTWCKENLHTSQHNDSLGNKLDRAIRKGQDNQTVGIPVGPDTSRIMSEIIAVSIDRIVKQQLRLTRGQSCRYIDDYFIGFDNVGSAEIAVGILAMACRKFEMELSDQKTRTLHSAPTVENAWVYELREFPFSKDSLQQRRSLEQYFTRAFLYSSDFPDENVLNYAIKRTRSVSITEENWSTYEMYLLKAARSNATVMPSIVGILSRYSEDGYPICKDKMAKLVQDIILRNAPPAHHCEVSWALFLAIALRLRLSRSACAVVSELENSVCALLALDLEARGQINGKLDKRSWKQAMSPDGLRSSMWLLAYEADLKDWLPGRLTGYVESDSYFGYLKAKKISFYDPEKDVGDMRQRIRAASSVEDIFSVIGGGEEKIELDVSSLGY